MLPRDRGGEPPREGSSSLVPPAQGHRCGRLSLVARDLLGVAGGGSGTEATAAPAVKDEAILEVEIGTDIKVSNDNPGATLIPTMSLMYAPLSKRGVGELIQFSGRFVREGDCPLDEGGWRDLQRMTSPSFSFDFTAVCFEPPCEKRR